MRVLQSEKSLEITIYLVGTEILLVGTFKFPCTYYTVSEVSNTQVGHGY